MSADIGFTHIALTITDLTRSLQFYSDYAQMRVVHRRSRSSGDGEVAWISDGTRPFVIVLLEVSDVNPLLPFSHLGFACATKERFDELCARADAEGILTEGPHESGPPVGTWALLRDPDGHTVELSFGQEVALAVENAG